RFFVCKHCGNIVGLVHNGGGPLSCCGEEMTELIANTVDASLEKHVPVAKVEGNKVTVNVGEVDHPMLEEHYIMWIYLKTDKGGHRICLKPGEAPKAVFALADEKPIAVYEYCNLHGLWKAEI
ncbi:MAG TPA: desulfoferrodoxin family protein, partial [Clostridiales bacterium]|nr:desulfoferrodoxin family protein [Clostridiales bacterium]